MTDSVQQAFEKLAKRSAVALGSLLRDTGATQQRAMVQKFKPYGGGGSDDIQTRSGALRRAFGFAVRGDGLNAELVMYAAGLPYIKAQEYGATIRPTRRRFLTIPLQDALTPSGTVKGGAKLVPRGRGYATADGAPTYVFRSKRGNLLIAARTPNGRSKLLYALKTEVTLKPRLGFRDTYRAVTLPFLLKRLEAGA